MNKESLKFKTGETLAIASGEYDEYGVSGLYSVAIDFDAKDLFAKWALSSGFTIGRRISSPFCHDLDGAIEFSRYLIDNGFIVKVEYREMHIDTWGRGTDLSEREFNYS